MSEKRIIKAETILNSQIPEFIQSESPLFEEFLKQYYISQTHPTGLYDISSQLNTFKSIDTYTNDVFYTSVSESKCYLIDKIYAYSDTIEVNSTFGFPAKYGLLKIDDEIITYTGKTETTFTGCVRGFSGITDINDNPNTSSLVFTSSQEEEHESKTIVKNLNLIFYSKLFEKFKAQYLPDFERRELNPNVNIELILSRVRDFYQSKGSDISYKILFEILYQDDISIIKPQDYIIRTSPKTNFITKNVLVELISGEFNLSDIIGLTLYQDLPNNTTASASIYNVEFRPTDDLNLFEISLDSESFIYDFIPTKKTSIIEKVEDGILVDSTVGFSTSGSLYVKIKSSDLSSVYTTISYGTKSISKFSNISFNDSFLYQQINPNDELIEDRLAKILLGNGNVLTFRLINVIQKFDYSNTNTSKVNDLISISSFGENFSGSPEYNSWLYNYPTTHKVKDVDSYGFITLYDSVKFDLNESLTLVLNTGITTTAKVINITESNRIQVNNDTSNTKLIKKNIRKSILNQTEPSFIQNTYYNEENQSLIVAASGLPQYNKLPELNDFKFTLVGIGSIFTAKNINTNQTINHGLLSGNKIYLESSYIGISTGYYVVKKISESSISLYKSISGLCLSYTSSGYGPILLTNNDNTSTIGTAFISGYESLSSEFSNQLLLKEFNINSTLKMNKITTSNQINSIEEAYLEYKS